MKKILLILGIVGISLFSFTQAENFKYECGAGTRDNSCFDGSFIQSYDLINKTYDNQGYWKITKDKQIYIQYYINGSFGSNISEIVEENDIISMKYKSKSIATSGYNFKNLKFYKNGKLIGTIGDVNNMTKLEFEFGSSSNSLVLKQNQRKLSTSMDLQSASITDQISSLVSGKFVTMLATIIAIIALFSIIIRYVLRAIFK